MHLVVGHRWHQEDAVIAKAIADVLGILVFEARQKISGGGPAVLASFADPQRAETLAARLSQEGVPSLVADTEAVRSGKQPFYVHRFVLGEQALQLESSDREFCEIEYSTVELLLVAICKAGEIQTTGTETKRKFSLGKTLLAGGVPMTKKVQSEKTVTVEERDETLWLYTHDRTRVIFDRSAMTYDGRGYAMLFTRDLNFPHLNNEHTRLASQARYDDRLLKRASLVRLLGPSLNPETDHDLAFEILSRSLREDPV
jgi:hypothetical protein